MEARHEKIRSRLFPRDGGIPNHPHLPLVIMDASHLVADGDPAAWFEERFRANGWSATWRWTIYPYHHFHTTNHEVLGVVAGSANVQFGGPDGEAFVIRGGDVVVIPAGVAHRCLDATDEFLVVGAYPRGEKPDLLEAAGEDAAAAIARVPLPGSDPLHGPGGPLFDYWQG
jgi:uncharacterized protein YjlB